MKNNDINRRDVDVDTLVEILKTYKKKVTKNEKNSKKFLIDLGVLTEEGNLTKKYKGLCIPTEPA